MLLQLACTSWRRSVAHWQEIYQRLSSRLSQSQCARNEVLLLLLLLLLLLVVVLSLWTRRVSLCLVAFSKQAGSSDACKAGGQPFCFNETVIRCGTDFGIRKCDYLLDPTPPHIYFCGCSPLHAFRAYIRPTGVCQQQLDVKVQFSCLVDLCCFRYVVFASSISRYGRCGSKCSKSYC